TFSIKEAAFWFPRTIPRPWPGLSSKSARSRRQRGGPCPAGPWGRSRLLAGTMRPTSLNRPSTRSSWGRRSPPRLDCLHCERMPSMEDKIDAEVKEPKPAEGRGSREGQDRASPQSFASYLARKYVDELDGLRAISVLLVISVHMADQH